MFNVMRFPSILSGIRRHFKFWRYVNCNDTKVWIFDLHSRLLLLLWRVFLVCRWTQRSTSLLPSRHWCRSCCLASGDATVSVRYMFQHVALHCRLFSPIVAFPQHFSPSEKPVKLSSLYFTWQRINTID